MKRSALAGSTTKAWAFFEAQSPWYRHRASYRVMSAKHEDTRVRRLGALINAWARGERGDTRALVRQARATIAQEIAENKKELEITLSSYESDLAKLDNALTLANHNNACCAI